MTRSEEDIEQY